MKKIIQVILMIMLSSAMLLTSARAAPDEETPGEATVSPSPYPSAVTNVSDGMALLSKVIVNSVSQSTKNPDNTINVTVELKNYNTKALNDVMVSVGGLSAGTISLTKTFGPFRSNLSAGGTGSINFTLYASSTIVGGNFPITLTLSYVDESGAAVSLDRSISILIDRGTGLTGSQPSALSTPRLYVGSYSIGADKVFGGDEFELTFTLVSSGSTAVKNILLTLTSDSNAYTVKMGRSNQIYIGDIAENDSYTGNAALMANSTLRSGIYNIILTLQYESVVNTPYTSTALISIPMEQEQVLSIGSIKVPDAGIAGSRMLLNVSYENPGTTDIKNLVMLLSGNIPEKEKKVPIGTVKAGSTGNVDQFITPQDTGTQELQIAFTFEDADGNAYTTATRSVTLNVRPEESAAPASDNGTPSAAADDTVQTVATPSPGLNSYWLYFVIVGVVLLVTAAGITWRVLYVRKKKPPKWSGMRR